MLKNVLLSTITLFVAASLVTGCSKKKDKSANGIPLGPKSAQSGASGPDGGDVSSFDGVLDNIVGTSRGISTYVITGDINYKSKTYSFYAGADTAVIDVTPVTAEVNTEDGHEISLAFLCLDYLTDDSLNVYECDSMLMQVKVTAPSSGTISFKGAVLNKSSTSVTGSNVLTAASASIIDLETTEQRFPSNRAWEELTAIAE